MDIKSRTGTSLHRAVVAAALCGILAPAANAASKQCADYNEVMGFLSEKHAEAPVARGLSQDGRLVEVMASADGASWSIVVSKPDKSACIALAGEGWRQLAPGKARMVGGP